MEMGGIAGFAVKGSNLTGRRQETEAQLLKMSEALLRRGAGGNELWIGEFAALAHRKRTAETQRMTRFSGGYEYAVTLNGELYNQEEVRHDLEAKGWKFSTASDAEVILVGYLQYGAQIAEHLNGVFAFAVADGRERALYLFRDRAGVKPLFYTETDGKLLFSSELKGLFAAGIRPQIDRQGLNEIFSLGPAKTPGSGVFRGIKEVLPGHWIKYAPEGLYQHCYWKLTSAPHEESWEQTVEHTRFLLLDSIRRQIASEEPVCAFLSGGVDSSLVTAICAEELRKQGKRLTTYSFDFVDNGKNFKASTFQPSRDLPYVQQMVEFLGSDHHYLECGNEDMVECLYKAVEARDLPGMADVDASLLYFCSKVNSSHQVAMTGECADEIFGGYPWFHKQEMLLADAFPWSSNIEPRQQLLREDLIGELGMEAYIRNSYTQSVAQTPVLPGESKEDRRRREITWLNLRWFMQTLLDRMDRTGMYSGLAARVPFADYRIMEYLWNIPWEMKAKDGVVKGLLREAGRGLVPDEILFRRKSPYPKTYDPTYETMLAQQLRELILEGSAPVLQFLDREKTLRFLDAPSDYGKPWYGQLMAGPQMTAYVLQINYWMERYRVEIL